MKELGMVVAETKAFTLGSEDQEVAPPFKCVTQIGNTLREW